MPLYEVEHCIPLTGVQQDKLAELITQIHSRSFTTPSFFVNVDFIDVSKAVRYVAGKKKIANRIQAHVRPGSRTHDQFAQLCKDLKKAWDDIVNDGRAVTGEKELRAAFILGDISAVLEAGLVLPPGGKDKEWLKSNMANFKKLANEGDEDFQHLLQEMKERDDLKSVVGNEI